MKPVIYAVKSEKELDAKTFDFLFENSGRKEAVLRQKQKKSKDLKLLSEALAKVAIKKTFGIDILNQEIDYGEHGKPYILNHPDVHFNVSHSKNMVVCAVCDTPVGVDVEIIREYKERLARRISSDEELDIIEKSENKALEFIKLWTKKEAYLKFLGTGIQHFDFENALVGMNQNVSTKIYGEYAITVVW